MPLLTNNTSQDLQSRATGEIVPAGATVEITEAQAARVSTVHGVWVVTYPAPAEVPETRTAARTITRRGGRTAEISTAPSMETR